MQPLVKVENLSKIYPKTSSTGSRLRAIWSLLRSQPIAEGSEVLHDINFEIYPGESLAIIGKNGAGKSTLLKIISGIVQPTSGKVEVNGKIGALLELGSGFHPEYTGRENLKMAAALAGLDKKSIHAKLQEMIDFADIGKYIDEPVKHYSSGMVVRLGFSVVTVTRPELLITDEILAVGDQSFQRKCIQWIDQYLASGGTLMLVSHSMYHVKKLCKTAVWLENGRVKKLGDVHQVAQAYEDEHDLVQEQSSRPTEVDRSNYHVESMQLMSREQKTNRIMAGDALDLEVVLWSPDNRPPVLGLGILHANGTPVYGTSSEILGASPKSLGNKRWGFRLHFPDLALLPGTYTIRTHSMDPEGIRLLDTCESELRVQGDSRELGVVRLPIQWQTPGLPADDK
jgi:lipopolysaccharide transport system ATP-binding protein